ncbi:uncharacterized protein LOC143902282 isoform X1 [Temnothorax americanus]|uniref:uncharacterized protein LOC143902282 isoform X1 n=2 Tax=Temnothorax americanus TaxID=1964332 RepID=UPI004067AFDF
MLVWRSASTLSRTVFFENLSRKLHCGTQKAETSTPLLTSRLRAGISRVSRPISCKRYRIMQLTTCCRCCSLKTGTIFSGVCGIVLAVISLILIFTANVEWKTIIVDILDKTAVKIIFAINLCMTILISTLLIIGALRKNTFMMLPWVVLGIMLAVALLVSVLYTSIMFFINSEVLNGILWLVFGLIAVVVYTYMWLVVYSYFQQLRIEKMNKRMGPYGKPYNYRRA